ncbi:MAG: hypothetical protein IPL46_32870 [Saprospiraceae bacterium]|nr:hypothetical protein [Saprospiraceae bacterium]
MGRRYLSMMGICTLAALALQLLPWQPFVSLEGGFQILAPGELQHKVQEIETEMGTIDYHTYFLATKGDSLGNFVYMVSFYRSESLQIPTDSIDLLKDFFNASVEQAAQSVVGEVVIYDDLIYQYKYPGRFWRIHYNEGASVLKTRVYLIEGTFYSIQVATDASSSLSNDIDRFMNSFKLTKAGS